MTPKTNSRFRQLFRIVFINFVVLIGLYLLAEIVLHLISSGANPLMSPLLAKNVLRIRDPVYNHTLKPKFDGYDIWGTKEYRVFTNSLGFRDASTRDVPLVPARKRIIFIGDSFTEGLGFSYEDTFVGRFASAFPDLDVLNAAVSSYSPSVYYEKLNYSVNAGLKFDEAIVYIDVSDIQDEAIKYSYDERGVLQWDSNECSLSPPPAKAWWEKAFYVADFLNQRKRLQYWARSLEHMTVQDLAHPGGIYSREWTRPGWTYEANASCYGSMGVEGGIQKAEKQMDRLYEALSRHGVALSVGVYPWPQQLLYDNENSRQVQVWRDWCVGKCKQFFNHFPVFFRYKEKDPDFVKQLFIWGDFHFNIRGNQILADDLIEKFRQR